MNILKNIIKWILIAIIGAIVVVGGSLSLIIAVTIVITTLSQISILKTIGDVICIVVEIIVLLIVSLCVGEIIWNNAKNTIKKKHNKNNKN